MTIKKIFLFIIFIIFINFSQVVLAIEPCRILVVVGMEDERAIAAGDGVQVVVGTANAAVLRDRLSKIDLSGIAAVYSFGVAGGLDPALKPGDLLVSTQVIAQSAGTDHHIVEESWMADQNLLMAITLHSAKKASLKVRKGIFLGTDFEARDNPEAGNEKLREITGADIIDNESHIMAKFASEHNLPFVSVRAVSDSVNNPLPPAALVALDPVDGSPDTGAIARSILLNPLQIPALIRTAWEYHKALRTLKVFRNTVGFDKLTDCH